MFVHGNPDSYASLGVVDGLALTGMRAIVSFGAEDVVGGLSDTKGLSVEMGSVGQIQPSATELA